MAEVANNSVFSQNDSSNTGALPGLSGASPPSQIDNSIRALMGATKREHDWRNYSVTSTGSANAYVLTYSVAPDGYYTGQRFAFKTNFAVTGAATVNVNGLGAKTIKKIVSGALTDLSSGDIASGDYVDLVYDGTYFVWVNKGFASVSAASESLAGIVELATTAEAATGTDTTRAVTSAGVAAAVAALGGSPSGVVVPYAGSSAPSGWLFCYGQAVSRTTYAALFAAISTTYGVGDGSTTFNLPDLRGRVIAGQDDMGGTSANRLTNQSGGIDGDTLGAAGGSETHTLTTPEIPAHTHTVTKYGAGTAGGLIASTGSGAGPAAVTSSSTGGDGAHNNVQPTIILNYIIKE